MIRQPTKTRIIGCGMIAREILAVIEANNWDHLDLKCLPAMWHHHPEKIANGVEQAIEDARAEGFESIFIAYAECGTMGELDKVCEKHGVERIAGPHCFSFYWGNESFADADEEHMTAFLMTDFLCRHFEAFFIKPLGLDRHPELKEMYFGNYEKLIYLAQTEDQDLEAVARAAAHYLGLSYEHRFTGYGDLIPALSTSHS